VLADGLQRTDEKRSATRLHLEFDRAQATDLVLDSVPLTLRLGHDAFCFPARLLEKRVSLLRRLGLDLFRCALAGHETVAQQTLELFCGLELLLELSHARTRDVALVPDLLVARCNVLEQLVDVLPVIAPEAAFQLLMLNFGGERNMFRSF